MTPDPTRLRDRFDADPGNRAAFEALEELFFVAGQWADLIALYEAHLAATDATRPASERARLHFRLAQAIEESGGGEPARAALHAAIELDPHFAPARERLRSLALAEESFEEAIDRVLADADSTPGCVTSLVEIGERALERGRTDAAVRSFDEALARAPRDARALAGSARALEHQGQPGRAVAAWERVRSVTEGAERAATIEAIGALLAGPLADLEGALTHFQGASDEAPDEPRWLERCFALLVQLGRMEAAAAIGARRFEQATDSARRAAIAYELGRLQLDALGAPAEARVWLARAIEAHDDGATNLAMAQAAGQLGDAADRVFYLERAMELGAEIPEWSDLGLEDDAEIEGLRARAAEHPDDPDALDALAGALAGLGEHAERIEILERRARLATTDPAERAELWFEIGELRAERRSDPESAIDAFRQALLADPERALGLDAIESALRRSGRLGELAEMLAPALAAASPARLGALRCRLGNAALEQAHAADALAQFRAALAADPGSPRARAGLARAAEASGDEAALFDAWCAEIARCDAAHVDRIGRAILERAREGEMPERALPALREWAARAPAREPLEALATVLGEAGQSDELAAVLDALDTHLEPAARAAHRRRLGYQHAAEGRSELALAAWRSALAHDPTDAASFEALAGALAEAGSDGELIALCEARSPAAPRSPLADSLFARALERAGRSDDATRVLRRLAASGAADDAAVDAFERVARAAGEPLALSEALALRVEREGDADTRERLALERAELLEIALDQPELARAAYLAIELRASDPARRSRATLRVDALLERTGALDALCERLAERAATLAPSEAFSTHIRVAEIAASRLADPERARRHLAAALAIDPGHAPLWRRLAELAREPLERLHALEGELGAAPGHERELALHLAIAALAERELADPALAARSHRAALGLDPAEPTANEFVAAELESAGRHAELADLLGARIAAATDADPAFLSELRLRQAALLAGPLDRPEAAVAVLEAARIAVGPLAAVAEPLAIALARLGRNEECAALCEAAARQAPDPAGAASFWSRAADACSMLGDERRAARCLRAACEADPEPRTRRIALIALSRRLGDDGGLLSLLEAELREPDADVLALHCELALRNAALGRSTQACDHAVAAAALAPFDVSLREPALERALALGREQDAVTLLEAAARDPRSHDPAALWRRHGACVAARDAEAAAASFARSLEIEPSQPVLRRERRGVLERLGRDAEALVELELEIECAGAEERSLLIAHGADLALRAHGAADSLPWLTRLAAEAPDDAETWSALALRYHLAGKPQAEERALREAEQRSVRPADRAALARRRAALLEGPLEDPLRALAAWRVADELAPGAPETLAALDRLYTQSGRTRDALEITIARAERSRGDARSQLLQRAARAAESLGETRRAAALWRDALAPDLLVSARRAELLENAVEAQRRAGDLDAFLALGEEELRISTSEPTRVASLHRSLARAWRDECARPERALVHLRALVDSGLADADDRAALLDGLRAIGARSELAAQLAERLRGAPDDVAAWEELAVLREEALWDATGAAEAWRALARLEPESAIALAGLRRASQRDGDARALDASLEREIELGLVDPAAAWRRLGQLRRSALHDLAGAERAFERALAIDAANVATIAALRQLAEARSDWTRALTLGAQEIERTEDPERRRALWLQRADRAAGPARDLACAAAAFAQADRLAPLTAAGLAAWAGVLRETGPTTTWRAVFARACDHPDAKTDVRDHLALALALADAGENEAAAARLQQVFAGEPDHAAAWALAARLREASGDAEAICEAWSRAARASRGLDAARAWRAAAAPFESVDPARALSLLGRAVEQFPAFAPAHAARAIAAERLGRHEEAVAAAKAALDGRGVAAPLLRDEHRDAARAGARAAHACERWSEARELASEALALAPGDPDALLVQGIAAARLGSPSAARRALEGWLEAAPADTERARPLAALGDALEALGETELALARYEEALALEPSLDEAHAARCALLERAGRSAAAADAFARWAERSTATRDRAERLVRTAQLLGVTERGAAAWLRRAIETQPDHADAWLGWLAHLAAHGSAAEQLAAATQGAAQLSDPRAAAALEITRAQLLEARGDETGARQAYVRAVELDASRDEAAWAAARLLRRSGEWSAAATCLGAAADRHPDPSMRASLLLERGQLCAGPLEDLSGALAAYEQARALAPDRVELREALASVWAQHPGGHERALTELRAAMALDPVRPTVWRRLARLLREEGREQAAANALALLRAVGAATALERESAPPRLAFAIGARTLADPLGETLRDAFLAIAGDWSEAIGSSEAPLAAGVDPDLARMSHDWRAACAEIAGPALVALDSTQLAEQAEALLWTSLGAAATVDATRETRSLVERVSGRALRRLRRGIAGIEPAALRRFDFLGWALSLRALALACAVDRNDGDLRAALGCARADAMRVGADALPEEADLTPFLASRGTLRLLAERAARAWLATL